MIETKQTTCNRDCPDACSIVATVEDGQVIKIQGDRAHPVTKGFLCYRTALFLETQYSPKRLMTPLIRRSPDAELEPAGWDEALDFAARKLLEIRQQSGPAAILHYSGGGTLGILRHLADWFFEKLGPTATKRGDVCSGAGDAAQLLDFGIEDSNDLFDLLNSKSIILWGKNVHTSSPHTVPVLIDAKRKGARLVLVDPVHHRGASLCDSWHQPRPGGDFALAMATARVLFERGWADPRANEYCDHLEEFERLAFSKPLSGWCAEADVAEAAAVELAQSLGPGKPCAILVGWGMGRRQNGGANIRALDALGAVSGNLGISGGGVSFYFARRAAFDLEFIEGLKIAPRSVSEARLGRDILSAKNPPIRAVWITAANPVAMLPESEVTFEALRSRELTVVVDSFLTDTARAATLVLPTTTLLEADDLLGSYGHHHLAVARPVVPPPAGVKSDLQILQALASRVGLTDEMAGDAREWKLRLTGRKLKAAGVTLEQLEQGPVINPLAPKILFADRRFKTPSGKVNLIHQEPPEAPRPIPEYPLLLSAVSTEKSQSSQWARPVDDLPLLTVHPDAAAGIADQAVARLESSRGSIRVRVKHDPSQRRDLALMPKGGHLGDGRCANALIDGRESDLGGGVALYDQPVRLVRIT